MDLSRYPYVIASFAGVPIDRAALQTRDHIRGSKIALVCREFLQFESSISRPIYQALEEWIIMRVSVTHFD